MKTAKILMASAAASLLLGSAVQATPSVTGFYIGIQAGGAYNQFKQGFRPKDGKKDTQVDFIDAHKNSFYLGAHVGYNYEFTCGLVVGAEITYSYDFAKIKHKDDNTFSGKTLKAKDGTSYEDLVGFYTLEAKPQHTYGFHTTVGGKMMPNFLAYVSLGVEGNYVSIKEQFGMFKKDGKEGAVWANGDWTKVEKQKISDGVYISAEENKTDKASVTHIRFVPGLGVKYFLDNGMYVGLQCQLPIGWNKKLDDKYLGGTTKYTYGDSEANVANHQGTALILKDKFTSHVKSGLAVRYGLTLGYKF